MTRWSCDNVTIMPYCWFWWGMGESEIPLGLNRETIHWRTPAHTAFVDTAKRPIARTIFFFIYLKQMLSEKWQDATPSKISLCLLEKNLLLRLRQHFTSWGWHKRGKAGSHLEMKSMFLMRISEKRKLLWWPALQLDDKCTFSAAKIRAPLNPWDTMCS